MRTFSIALFVIPFVALSSCAARGTSQHAGDLSALTAGPILNQAEGLFRNMKARDYPAIWALLSEKSRETIVGDVLKESGGTGEGKIAAGEIARDLAQGGAIARAYWDGYLREFDPGKAFQESRWEMGEIGEETAEVRITHKRSERPAVLRMVREGGVWKVGLIETFRPRPLQ